MFSTVQFAAADSIPLNPSKHNTLIQATNPAAQLSNGQGDIFVGRTGQDGTGQTTPTISIRRGLIEFNVAGSVPAGATITDVTLSMVDIMGLNGDRLVELHDALQDWGEGQSFQPGGMGSASQNGDASWLYTFYNAANPGASTTWTTPGGSYSSTVSGSSAINDDNGPNQTFTWSSISNPQMIADVQSWLDHPLTNYGWLMKENDETIGQTAKRLSSGTVGTTVPPSTPTGPFPVLTITYTVPEPSSLALGALAAVGLTVSRFAHRRRS
ncbi:MAG TPA: PEP-CTERM sorting domain-containing protein [Pirellulales bacterium]